MFGGEETYKAREGFVLPGFGGGPLQEDLSDRIT
jgi:hypothetical protein